MFNLLKILIRYRKIFELSSLLFWFRDDPVQNFDFNTLCFICSEPCAVVPDERHPDRFDKKPGILCRTADRGKSKEGIKRKSFKEVLLDVCESYLSYRLLLLDILIIRKCFSDFVLL